MTGSTVPSTETREDDAERLATEIRALVGGAFQIDCQDSGEWGVTWWEFHPDDPSWERECKTYGAAPTLADALREAVEIIRERRS